jgi:hypothetical protein
MKKILVLAILIAVSVLFHMIAFFPWWCFTIPVFLLGIVLPLKKWRVQSFFWGFAAGFFEWLGCTIYFEIIHKGEIMEMLAETISLNFYLLHIFVGFIGGLLVGLAFYSGFLLRQGKEFPRLELNEDRV